MSITNEQVAKIAHLARLAVDDQATQTYTEELSNILELVAQMDQVDTEAVQPMAHPMDATQRLRPDEVSEQNLRDVMQNIAPQTEGGLYLVPQVIE